MDSTHYRAIDSDLLLVEWIYVLRSHFTLVLDTNKNSVVSVSSLTYLGMFDS